MEEPRTGKSGEAPKTPPSLRWWCRWNGGGTGYLTTFTRGHPKWENLNDNEPWPHIVRRKRKEKREKKQRRSLKDFWKLYNSCYDRMILTWNENTAVYNHGSSDKMKRAKTAKRSRSAYNRSVERNDICCIQVESTSGSLQVNKWTLRRRLY